MLRLAEIWHINTKLVGLLGHLVCGLYLKCGKHICSVMYVSHIYSTPLLHGWWQWFHMWFPCVHILHIWLPNVWHIDPAQEACLFLERLTVTWSRQCWLHLAFMYKNIGSVCLFSFMDVWPMFTMLKPYLFGDRCMKCSWSRNSWHWVNMWHIYVYSCPIYSCQIHGMCV